MEKEKNADPHELIQERISYLAKYLVENGHYFHTTDNCFIIMGKIEKNCFIGGGGNKKNIACLIFEFLLKDEDIKTEVLSMLLMDAKEKHVQN